MGISCSIESRRGDERRIPVGNSGVESLGAILARDLHLQAAFENDTVSALREGNTSLLWHKPFGSDKMEERMHSLQDAVDDACE